MGVKQPQGENNPSETHIFLAVLGAPFDSIYNDRDGAHR